ncbi:hypothetical protein GCM10010431_66280 [Streptomyces kunmingensis]
MSGFASTYDALRPSTSDREAITKTTDGLLLRAGPDTVDLTALASRLTEQYPLNERPLTLTCDSTAPAHARGNPDEYERLLRNPTTTPATWPTVTEAPDPLTPADIWSVPAS